MFLVGLNFSVNNSLAHSVHSKPRPFSQLLTCKYNVQFWREQPAHLFLFVNNSLTQSVHSEPPMLCTDDPSFSQLLTCKYMKVLDWTTILYLAFLLLIVKVCVDELL